MRARPEPGECLPYYHRYIALVGDGDIVATLQQQPRATLNLLRGVGEERAGHRYEAGKWSIKQMVGHLIDAERVFAYRALRFGRNDSTPLAGFEQNDYVANASFDASTLADLMAEFESVRKSTVALYRGFTDDAWLRSGVASGGEVTVRALAWITAGHELHHVALLREKYL